MTSRPVPQGEIKHQKMSDAVADILQQMIIDNRLESGQKITQDEIAKMLGVSTMPVREALLKLAAIGLIDAEPNRSFRIVNSTKADLRDSYWLHSLLAGELARRACKNKGSELAPELERHLKAYSAAADAGDADTVERESHQFYRAINLAADSPRLLFMVRANLQFLPEHWYPRLEGWISLSQAAHKKIIRAFKQGNADRAAEVASTHMRQAGELLIKHFESIGRWSATSEN